MAEEMVVARRRVRIANSLGLHLRAADAFVRLAQTYRAEVWVAREGLRVNGKSILDLISLAAAPGTSLDIEVRGLDAGEAVAALATLVTAGFDTDEGR